MGPITTSLGRMPHGPHNYIQLSLGTCLNYYKSGGHTWWAPCITTSLGGMPHGHPIATCIRLGGMPIALMDL